MELLAKEMPNHRNVAGQRKGTQPSFLGGKPCVILDQAVDWTTGRRHNGGRDDARFPQKAKQHLQGRPIPVLSAVAFLMICFESIDHQLIKMLQRYAPGFQPLAQVTNQPKLFSAGLAGETLLDQQLGEWIHVRAQRMATPALEQLGFGIEVVDHVFFSFLLDGMICRRRTPKLCRAEKARKSRLSRAFEQSKAATRHNPARGITVPVCCGFGS
jgi:hypothetical protein